MILSGYIEYRGQVDISKRVDIPSILIIGFVHSGHGDILNKFYQYLGTVFVNIQRPTVAHKIVYDA